jgi:hypothetical protein
MDWIDNGEGVRYSFSCIVAISRSGGSWAMLYSLLTVLCPDGGWGAGWVGGGGTSGGGLRFKKGLNIGGTIND